MYYKTEISTQLQFVCSMCTVKCIHVLIIICCCLYAVKLVLNYHFLFCGFCKKYVQLTISFAVCSSKHLTKLPFLILCVTSTLCSNYHFWFCVYCNMHVATTISWFLCAVKHVSQLQFLFLCVL